VIYNYYCGSRLRLSVKRIISIITLWRLYFRTPNPSYADRSFCLVFYYIYFLLKHNLFFNIFIFVKYIKYLILFYSLAKEWLGLKTGLILKMRQKPHLITIKTTKAHYSKESRKAPHFELFYQFYLYVFSLKTIAIMQFYYNFLLC